MRSQIFNVLLICVRNFLVKFIFLLIASVSFSLKCSAQEAKEEEIFNLYTPDYQNEEPIVLDFGADLVKITSDVTTTGSNKRDLDDLKSRKIDITIEDTTPHDQGIETFEEFVNDGLLALSKGHYEAADILYRKALKFDSQNNDIFFAIGYANQMMDNNEIAKDFYKRILKTDKYYVKAFQNFFSILAHENPSYTIQKLKEMAQNNPYHPVILSQLGATYFKVNNLQLALKYYLRALQMDPQNAQYNYNTAIIYEQLKDYEFAIQYYENTLKHMDDYENADLSRVEIAERIRYLGRADT